MPESAKRQPARDEAGVRRRVLVVYNPTAGGSTRPRFDRVLEHLSRLGATVTVRETMDRGDAERIAANASSGTFDIVVAAGGDGTINEVVNGLVGSDLPLAIVPLGTANVLAAEIGMPLRARRIARAIVRGEVRSVHVGSVNGRRFLMMAGVGFDAHVVANVDPRLKRAFGKLAYVVETLVGLFRFPYRHYRVIIDGTPHDAASVVIANSHYYGGRFTCAPQARLDDPALHVCLFERSGPWSVLRYGWGLVAGRLHRLRDVRVIAGSGIRIEGATGEPVQCDGDITGKLPLVARADAARMNLVVGAAAAS